MDDLKDELVIGWAAAAEVAGLPISSLRRRAVKGEVPVEKGPNSINTFRRTDLEALRQKLQPDPPLAPVASPGGSLNGHAPAPSAGDGDPAAVVFADLSAGKLPVEIVAERKLSPDFVRNTFGQWQDLRRLDPKLVPPDAWVQKMKDLDANVEQLAWETCDEDSRLDALTERIGKLESRVNGDPLAGLRETFVCSCGEKGKVAARVYCTACRTDTALGWHPQHGE
jgi:hypothetical protein